VALVPELEPPQQSLFRAALKRALGLLPFTLEVLFVSAAFGAAPPAPV